MDKGIIPVSGVEGLCWVIPQHIEVSLRHFYYFCGTLKDVVYPYVKSVLVDIYNIAQHGRDAFDQVPAAQSEYDDIPALQLAMDSQSQDIAAFWYGGLHGLRRT